MLKQLGCEILKAPSDGPPSARPACRQQWPAYPGKLSGIAEQRESDRVKLLSLIFPSRTPNTVHPP
eukprot:1191613-Prorocentrum_minimum.AAC.3